MIIPPAVTFAALEQRGIKRIRYGMPGSPLEYNKVR